MTKPRAPLSIEQALQRVAGQLPNGVEQMAEVTERSASMVRKWMDPDRSEQVSIELGIELDLAFRAEGGEGAPIYEAYGTRLDLAQAEKFAIAHRLHDYAHGVIKEGGEAHAAIVAASRPGASLAERQMAFKEAAEAYEKLRDILPLLEEGARAFHEQTSSTQGDQALAQAP